MTPARSDQGRTGSRMRSSRLSAIGRPYSAWCQMEAGAAGFGEDVEGGPQNGGIAGRVPGPPTAYRDVAFGDRHDATPTGTRSSSTTGLSSRARAGRKSTTPRAATSVMAAATSPIRWRPLTKLLLAAAMIGPANGLA